METIKIKFDQLWPGFDTNDNDFTRILSKNFHVEITDEPDFYFFTHPYNGKRNYLEYSCHRIFLGWENERADWTMCDYVLDSDFVEGNPRHKRFPIWAGWDLDRLTRTKDPDAMWNKKKFCCMLVSNAKAKERIDFFHQLSKYKKVDSGGKYLNNIGGAVDNKMEFIKDYKFVISFENSSHPGYTTEKLIEPMLVNSTPIYWGNTVVGKDFNTKSFVNVHDHKNFDDSIAHIIELDSNEAMFKTMAAQPWLINNSTLSEMSHKNFNKFFEFILNDRKSKNPVAKSLYKTMQHECELFIRKTNDLFLKNLRIQKGFR